ncbi:hypothetical protein [Reichenbachiella faecimaris]|uniref:hypothetical protein n=1 Tax=Reichenbachiella faecimaris TaxID=692418 RepID=UPI000A03DDE7|nr:hypothetical protein [Reichenbachiella faecimaris]
MDPPDAYVDMSSTAMLSGQVDFPWGEWIIGGAYIDAVPAGGNDDFFQPCSIGLYWKWDYYSHGLIRKKNATG